MKPILIVKLGSTIPSLAQSHGDFEDWIEARLCLPAGQVAVVDPQRAPLPEPRHFSGVILTGSHSMVTDHEPWSERTAGWIPTVMEAQHSAAGHLLRPPTDRVRPGRRGRPEPARPRVRHRRDHVAGRSPRRSAVRGPARHVCAHASHAQSVLRLPPGATWLRFNSHDPHHAYTVGRSTWCVQFHPEFDELAMRTYIDVCADELRVQGDDPAQLRALIAGTPHAEELLRRFAEQTHGNGQDLVR